MPPSKRTAWVNRIGWVGFVLTLGLVGLITLTPQSPTSTHASVSRAILEALHGVGVPQSLGPTEWEFVANIIMFTPLGFFWVMALTPRRPWWGVLLFPLMSATIELSQKLFLPSRFATIQDVVANSLGGWIGLLVGVAVVLCVRRFREKKVADQSR